MENHSDSEITPFLSLSAAISYGIASMAMVFINKAILMQYAHSMTLLTLQQLATAMLIHFGRRMGYTKAKALDMATARKLLPISLFYNANVAFALASLKGVNIPMYIAIKRLTPLAVLIAGFFSGKGRPTIQVSLSVILTAAGVIIAALGDFSFDLFGYSMALTSVFFQTMYLVLVEKSGAEDGLSSIEIMFYNSFLSLPFLLFVIIATGEFPNSLALLFAKREKVWFPAKGLVAELAHSHAQSAWGSRGERVQAAGLASNSLYFLVILILSLVMGIVLNFTMFLCTIVNSALTTTIVGVLKGVGSTTLGFVLLGGVEVHALNVTGLVINTAGGVWYSYAKYQQKKNKPPKLISDLEAHSK
uniref:Sugar phosphate transporter domain-containing protein n=1 Tax=Quercus lobata TaxID=97700 RepID=A0A7N2REQ9_QUELO